MKSMILDRGREVMSIYSEEQYEDSRGNKKMLPTAGPVQIRVTVSEDRGSDAELPGQVSSEVLRVVTRSAPAGSWSRIVFRGQEWDIAAPPIRTPGISNATRHIEFNIRSRNGEKRA